MPRTARRRAVGRLPARRRTSGQRGGAVGGIPLPARIRREPGRPSRSTWGRGGSGARARRRRHRGRGGEPQAGQGRPAQPGNARVGARALRRSGGRAGARGGAHGRLRDRGPRLQRPARARGLQPLHLGEHRRDHPPGGERLPYRRRLRSRTRTQGAHVPAATRARTGRPPGPGGRLPDGGGPAAQAPPHGGGAGRSGTVRVGALVGGRVRLRPGRGKAAAGRRSGQRIEEAAQARQALGDLLTGGGV